MADNPSKNATSDVNHSHLVKTVYKNAWIDFYDWEQEHCFQTLNSLSRVLPDDASDLRNNVVNGVGTLSGCFARISPVPDCKDETFTEIDYSTEGEPETVMLPVVTVQSTIPFDPCASYEICTPTNRNISVGDDSDYMPFIPLVDDPTFSAQRHAEDYEYFQWEMPFRDPDLEVIVARTVHDLHHKHKLSFQAIDETKILPIPVQPRILVLSQRRDFPEWPAIKSQSRLPHSSLRAMAGAPEQLEHLVGDFCSNANCLIGYCSAHVHMKDIPMPESVPPTVFSDDLVNSVLKPCGSDCFLLEKVLLSVSPWSDQDVETLATVLSLSPDLSPCNLAVICRKPCFEVFKHRKRLIPDSTIGKATNLNEKKRPGRKAKLRFNDHEPTIFTPNWPCSHPGPCDARYDCECFKNSAHCVRSCRCDRNCIRRWPGCTCSRSKYGRTCGTLQCPCYRARRECDPEVCAKCEARVRMKDFESDTCKNVSIQRGDRKRTQVRQSKWGLGLYTDEEIKEDDLILEYTGEIVFETTTLCRELVSQHRQRSYLFTLNATCTIDSTKVGNESRFINHDTKANCHAQIRLVNGEHRIGIFARRYIPPGIELALNYGDWFFKEKDDADVEDTSRIQNPDSSLDQVLYNLDQHSSDETYSSSDSGTTADF